MFFPFPYLIYKIYLLLFLFISSSCYVLDWFFVTLFSFLMFSSAYYKYNNNNNNKKKHFDMTPKRVISFPQPSKNIHRPHLKEFMMHAIAIVLQKIWIFFLLTPPSPQSHSFFCGIKCQSIMSCAKKISRL